jgi:hypothetical protein
MENCECQIDWALCTENDCPRATWIRALQGAAEVKGRELLELDHDGGSDGPCTRRY